MKKSLNKSVVLLFALALVLAIVLAIVPTMFGETASEKAHAEGTTVDLSTLTEAYTAQDGEILTGTLGGKYRMTIASGATVTLKDVTISSTMHAGLTCNGATLILKGKNTVGSSAEYCPGILVTDYSQLTISGDGSLDVYGATNAAGIGGRYNTDCGTIVIESGTITAHGGTSGAGIGSGNYSACSGIEISGGIVKAYGGEDGGAGIGTGAYSSSCAYINISGGRIYAQGTDYEYEWGSAGIGAGVSSSISSGDSTCANITITGGNIEAVGGPGAAAIGAGSGYKFYDEEEEYSSTSECNEILITDGVGKLKATKGSGSPQTIGGGKISSCAWGVKVLGGGAVTESPYIYLAPGPAGVIVLIDEIPNPVVVNNACKNAIAAAREAYDKLETEEQKALVTNYNVLTDAEAVFAIANANDKIDAIPAVEDITVADKDKIEAARAAYDALGDKKDEIDPEKVAKLEAAEAKYAEVKEADDTAKANNVSEKVNALPAADDVTVENKEAIETARAEYEKLTEDQLKKLPDGTLAKLEAAEQALKIAIVEDLIDQIPDTFTLETLDEIKEKIDAARAAYDKLPGDEQELVDENKYETLTDAESAYIVWKVLALINEIPEELENTTECIRKIDAAFDAYDALSSKQKPQIVSDDKMKLFEAEAWHVDEMIDEIGDVEYTPACKEKIDDARAEYEKLSATVNNTYNEAEADKIAAAMALVTEYDVLVEAEADYKAYDDAAQVEELIANIGEVELTVNSKVLIDAAREAYDALSDEEKEIVSNYDVLTAAESAYKILVAEDAIENIGDVTYTAESKEKIDAAREAFDALSDEEKAEVENASVLTAAESKYAKMKADEEAAATVRAKIEAIGDVTYTAESKAKIDEAREAYDALGEEQKALVGNVSDLTNAESEYGRLEDNAKIAEVKALIESIGTVEYSESSKAKISAARQAYDNLTDAQKALLDATEVETLTTAETVYEQKEIEATTVKKGLSGGAIAGIVIGVVIGALLLACVVLYLLNKKKIVKLAFVDKATEKVTDVAGKIKDKFGKKDAQKGEEPKQEAQQEEPKQEEPVQEEPQQEAAEEEPAKAESTEDEAHE